MAIASLGFDYICGLWPRCACVVRDVLWASQWMRYVVESRALVAWEVSIGLDILGGYVSKASLCSDISWHKWYLRARLFCHIDVYSSLALDGVG